MSKLSSTNEMLSCRQRTASARCEATAPPSDVPVGMRSNTTVILATFPPEKTTVPRFPEIAHPVWQMT